MNKQDQKVTKGSVAIQSGGDTIIGGLAPADMKQILEALGAHLTAYTAVAREIVDARLVDFEHRILQRFSDTNTSSSEAFKDPDFQYLITRAQHAYARSGDEVIRDTLVDLIAERSRHSSRSRLSLTLNDAVERVTILTPNEFAELSLNFFVRYTLHPEINSIPSFRRIFRRYIQTLLPDISTKTDSYEYLEARGCCVIEVGSIDLRRILTSSYGGLFSSGFTLDQLHDHLPDGKKDIFDQNGIIVSCINDASKVQFNALNKSVFMRHMNQCSLEQDSVDNVWNMFESTFWSENQFREKLPELGQLFDLWNGTLLKRMRLTTVGKAIGHANLTRLCGFGADLGMWVG